MDLGILGSPRVTDHMASGIKLPQPDACLIFLSSVCMLSLLRIFRLTADRCHASHRAEYPVVRMPSQMGYVSMMSQGQNDASITFPEPLCL